ncbi:MAG: single-stranded DNA-binding protein [Treponema sp.]|jgi:single-strand DNA-binding protein|nr:single-stranded DNA-binding protein [Treponema sp.]
MVDINHVVLIGRLTRDAELKSIASGQAVCKFSIAVNRRKKNGDQWEDEANFFDIVVWGRQGESLHQYLVKGKMIAVDGELRQDRWQQDGQNRSKIEIVANNIQLLGGNPGSGGGGGYNNSGYNGQGNGGWQSQGGSAPAQASAPAEGSAAADDHFADDIPF